MAFYVDKIPLNIFRSKATLKRCWLPRRCTYSGQFLWFKLAYKLETDEYDMRETYKVYTWIEKDLYLMMKLRDQF